MDKYEADIVSKVDNIWQSAITVADNFISKNDLSNLLKNEIEPLDSHAKTEFPMEIYSLDRLSYNPDEGIVDKLVNVYSAMHSLEATLFIIVHGSKNNNTQLYIGCRSIKKTNVARTMLKKNFEGNFPGIELVSNLADEKSEILDKLFPLNYQRKSIAILSVSADYRMDKAEKTTTYIQGIEKFIDTMKGQEYTAYFLAEPISKQDCQAKRQSYENIITELSKYNKLAVTYNESDSVAVSESLTAGISQTISDSISHSVSTNTSISIGKSKGYNTTTSYNFFGKGHNRGRNRGKTKTNTTGDGESDTTGKTIGITDTISESNGKSTTSTHGTNFTINYVNKHVGELIDRFEYELKKLEHADSYGLWDAAAYMIADDEDTTLIAANSIRSLVIGDESGKAESFINLIGNDSKLFNDGPVGNIMEFLHYGMHPVFKKQMKFLQLDQQKQSEYFFTPAVAIRGNVLPSFMGLPMKSVPGVTVVESAEFGRNIVTDDPGHPGNRKIHIGEILYMGKNDKTQVELYVNSLSSHTFICGAPGSGKSNTVYKIMYELMGLNAKPERDDGYGSVKWLVIEPAKGEYKYEFARLPNVNIYTTKNNQCKMLRINPFEFPYEEMNIWEHIERVKNIISACWPLTAAMPAILAESLEKAYLYSGWDLNNSIYVLDGEVKFPSFRNVLDVLPKIINQSGYSADAKGDYIGALVTRVASLTTGIVGEIFSDCGTVKDQVLFDENTIIDLSSVGSTEARSLIMGILVMKMENYRRSMSTQANYPLRHVTILEEAHNLLPKCNMGQSNDSANVQGKSVESISNAISEMRTFGEGFIIVDQSPSAVADVAVSNTSTKIVMRLPSEDDVEAASSSVGLDEYQRKQIPMLSRGQAIIKQGNWINPVMALVNHAPNTYYGRRLTSYDYDILKIFRAELLEKCMLVNTRNIKRKKIVSVDRDKIIVFIDNEKNVAEHYKDFYKVKWLEFCEQKPSERHNNFGTFVMDILAFSNGLTICSPNLKEKPKSLNNPTGEYLQTLKNWIDKMEVLLSSYVTASEDEMTDIIYWICYYCMMNPPALSYKICGSSMILMAKVGKP